MPYSNFTLSKVKSDFRITTIETETLFPQIEPVQPGELLTLNLKENLSLATAINTEKARSELIIMPVLTEVRRVLKGQVSLFSGVEFNVDLERGLNGTCDFIPGPIARTVLCYSTCCDDRRSEAREHSFWAGTVHRQHDCRKAIQRAGG